MTVRLQLCEMLTLALLLAPTLRCGILAPTTAAAESFGSSPPEIKVHEDGTQVLVRYTTEGVPLLAYTGFSRVSDVTTYDPDTVLVAEEDHDRISAVRLDGQIAWMISVHRPRHVEVLEADRFLVCQDDPPGVAEIDRAGNIFWQVTGPFREAAAAVRMPDGNTAVVEGRGPHAVHVLSPDGHIVWTGTEHLAQPRGLAMLPSGELATSGFDTHQAVIFRPYTNQVRWLDFCCHGEDVTVTKDGDLLTIAPETQLVRLWERGQKLRWQFRTLYPPYHGDMLSDGTLLVSVDRVPDRTCLNASLAKQHSKRPIAPYWIWLGTGLGAALLLTAVMQWHPLRAFWQTRSDPPGNVSKPEAAEAPGATRSRVRRLEVGLYVVSAVACALLAAVYHRQFLLGSQQPMRTYALLVGTGGIALALIQRRMPSAPTEWRRRMAHLAPMSSPSRRMYLLWLLGGALVALSFAAIARQGGDWALGPWIAGLVFLIGGCIQPPTTRPRVPGRAVMAGLLLIGFLSALRLYRLEEYPPNLHLDMALWSVEALRLVDGNVPTMLTNGYADIPLMGHFWSALWSIIAGRSLAACRLPAAIGSIIAIVGAFVLVRRLYGVQAAVIAAVLLGVNHGFLHFSRIQAYMDPVPFHVIGILGLMTGLETGGYGWFALAGVAGAYSALTYHAGRVTPPTMVLLAAVVLLRYPRALAARWAGLVLTGVVGLVMLGPQLLVYARGTANAFGRGEMYPWVHGGHVDLTLLRRSLAWGLPRVFGTFWIYPDSSTQYGALSPVFFPPVAALLGMAVVAAVLCPRDVRGIWIVLWGCFVLFVGGVLTVDPPAWPRLISAFVPAAVAAAIAADWICRGAGFALGRFGTAAARAGLVALLALTTWLNLRLYINYCQGIPPHATRPVFSTQWVQGIMGRDIQHWGENALIFIVAANSNEQSCEHPTVKYYAYAADVQDAREIAKYLPFKDTRTIVAYFFPEMTDQIATVRHMYPQLQEQPFYNNLGRHVFTRVVVPAPHS